MCQGYESPCRGLPCRAVPLALVAVYLIFSQSITGTFVLAAFLLESMARMILSGCFRHAMEYINNNNAYTQ